MPEPRLYVACESCSAKLFADVVPACCPRCGSGRLLVDAQTEPRRDERHPARTRHECDHTLHPIAESGATTGSWTIDRSAAKPRVVCGVCGKFYGYLRTPEEVRRSLYQAYQEQQRRRSCPGCGEEPFLG